MSQKYFKKFYLNKSLVIPIVFFQAFNVVLGRVKICNIAYYNPAKIYETNFSVGVKKLTTGKVQFQYVNSFLLVSTKFSFWEEDCAQDHNSIKIWDLLNIS